MNQSFYIKMKDTCHLYIDEKYLLCSYTRTDTTNDEICIISNEDDFEISITGYKAFNTFINIQEKIHEDLVLSWEYLIGELGMTQYG